MKLNAIVATEQSIAVFNEKSELNKAIVKGSFYIYGDVIAHLTINGVETIEFNVKWNRASLYQIDERYKTKTVQDWIKTNSETDFVVSDVGADIVTSVILGILNKVEGDDFEKGFTGLFGCGLTHKVTRNYITGGYLFQAKDEVAEKFALPNDVLIEDNVSSFIKCMQHIILMKS